MLIIREPELTVGRKIAFGRCEISHMDQPDFRDDLFDNATNAPVID